MGRGLSRAFIGMSSAVLGVFAKDQHITVDQLFDQPTVKGKPKAKKYTGYTGKMHGARECARRVRQGVAGTQYMKGAGYYSFPWLSVVVGRSHLFSMVPNHWKGKF